MRVQPKEQLNRQRGFTLIELMIVVVIVSILSAIAMPIYTGYAIRSKMSEPLEALAEGKSAMLEFVSANRKYPTDMSMMGLNLGQRNAEFLHSLSISPSPLVDGETVYIIANVYASVVNGGPQDSLNLLGFQLSGSTNADGTMTWECITGQGAVRDYPVPTNYLPPNCKG